MTILNNTFRIETSFYDRVICFVNTNQCLPHNIGQPTRGFSQHFLNTLGHYQPPCTFSPSLTQIDCSSKHFVAIFTIFKALAVSIINSCFVIIPSWRFILASNSLGPFIYCNILPLCSVIKLKLYYNLIRLKLWVGGSC